MSPNSMPLPATAAARPAVPLRVRRLIQVAPSTRGSERASSSLTNSIHITLYKVPTALDISTSTATLSPRGATRIFCCWSKRSAVGARTRR